MNGELVGLFQAVAQGEQLLEGTGNDTWVVFWSLDSVRFSRTRLSICEAAHIKTVYRTLHEHSGIFEYFLLAGEVAVAGIKRVLLFFVDIGVLVFFHADFDSLLIDEGDDGQCAHLNLGGVHGSYTTENSDLPLHVFNLVVEALPLQRLKVIFAFDVFLLVAQLFQLCHKDRLALFALFA